MFRKSLDFAEAGDNIGALLRGVDRTQIERGQVLAKPGTVHPHKVFEAQVYVLTKDEGGRHTPFFSNYRPQFLSLIHILETLSVVACQMLMVWV